MKKISIIIAFCFLITISQAQVFEVGINRGVSNTSQPNESLYNGDKGKWSYATDLNLHMNFSERWQAGFSIGMTKWERTGNLLLTAAYNINLGSRKVNYLYAKRAVSIAFQGNHVIPFKERYEDFVRSNLYFGLSAGVVVTGNDGNITYTKTNPNTPSEFTYISEFNYQSGYGTLLGVQVGYTYYFGEHLGINLEFAPKITWVKTVDPKYNNANDTYNLFYFPTTIGIHYRFGNYK